MTALENGYYIDADEMQYKLVKDTGRIDKKTGDKVFRNVSYHHTIKQVIEAYLRLDTRLAVSNMDISLTDLLKRLETACTRLQTIINNIKEI